MTKSKHTKKALLMSVLSMLVCMAMFVGSTFAWFTDSVTSGKNKIVAGNLDIELNYQNASMTSFAEVKADTENLFVTQEGTAILWEPGAVAVAYLEIKNAGSLALKYKLSVDAKDTVVGADGAALSKVLETAVVEIDKAEVGTYDRAKALEKVKAAGAESVLTYVKEDRMTAKDETVYLAMIVYFPEEVGNEKDGLVYNRKDVELKTELSLNLVATQTPYESDSFDENYDENAIYGDPWDGETVDSAWFDAEQTVFKLNKPEQLAGLAELVNGGTTFEGKTITLTENISLGDKEWTPIGDRTHAFMGTFDGDGHTISGIAMTRHWFENDTGLFNSILNATICDLKVDGLVKIVNPESSKDVGPGGSVVGGICAMAGNSTIERCTNSIDFDMTGMSIGNWNYYNCYTGGICGVGANILSDELTGRTEINDCLNEGNFVAKAKYGDVQTVPFMGGITTMTDCKHIFVNNAVNVGAFDIQGIEEEEQWALYHGVVALRGCDNWEECMPWDGEAYTTIKEVHRRGTETWYSSTLVPYLDAYDEDCLIDNPHNVVTSAEDMAKQETFVGFDFENVWELTNGKYPTLRK
ncbi:MAG: SipW-dependent-type signal peptide-containing protein [Clostridiales bacterium]|nr:SipW-dependent-type signal peptide-containing protein [Clostridiales bacterium]